MWLLFQNPFLELQSKVSFCDLYAGLVSIFVDEDAMKKNKKTAASGQQRTYSGLNHLGGVVAVVLVVVVALQTCQVLLHWHCY